MGFKFTADSNQLAFMFESGTYATASGARQWIGLVQNHTPDENMNVVPVRYQGRYSRTVGVFSDGPQEFTGTFSFYPQDWKMLAFAVGSVQNLTGSHLIRETNIDTVDYAVATQSLSSFTLEDSRKTPNTGSNFLRTINGCMIDSFNLAMTEGEIITCEVGYKGQLTTYSSGATTAVTPRTTVPYTWSNVSIHLPSGTKLPNCTEFTLNIANNLESRFSLNGSRTIEVPIPLNRNYEVDATFLMDTANAGSLYNNYYIAGNQFNSMVEMKASAGSAYIIMSGCKIINMELPSPVEGLNEQTCTIRPTNIYVNVYDSIGSYTAW